MAGSFKLEYGSTSITLSPIASVSPKQDVEHKIIKNIMLDGTLRIRSNYTKQYYEYEVNNVSKSDADTINDWKENCYTLVLTPNTDIPGTTYNVVIVNEGMPFQWMPNTLPDTKFHGIIMLREV